MRLLFLSRFYPLPANNGVKMRTWALLRAFAAEGHQITLLTFGDPGEVNAHYSSVRQVCSHIEWVPEAPKSLSSTSDYMPRLTALFLTTPYGVLTSRSTAI